MRQVDDVRRLLNAGADKVSINTAAVDRPDFVREGAEKFGAQCIVVAIDAKQVSKPGEPARWEIFTHGGRNPTGLDAVAYAREAGRNAAELDIVYRPHDYALHSDGHATAGSSHHRPPFVGTAAEIALDIRQYEALGVGYLVMDFARMSRTLEEMLQHMEAMATQVWPRVEAGEA